MGAGKKAVNQTRLERRIPVDRCRLYRQCQSAKVSNEDGPSREGLGLSSKVRVNFNPDGRNLRGNRSQHMTGAGTRIDETVLRREVAEVAMEEEFADPDRGEELPEGERLCA